MSDSNDNKWIGKRTIRPDGADKVTGRAAFAADANMPGMIWGKVLRSPHAHAKIVSIDTSKAEAHPDVMAVVTFDDFNAGRGESINAGEGSADVYDLARNCLAHDKVLYHGHALAAVEKRRNDLRNYDSVPIYSGMSSLPCGTSWAAALPPTSGN